MRESWIYKEKELRDSYPTERVSWGSLLEWFEQRFPLFSGMYLQKTASKSLLEMLQNTPKMLQKISVFTQKFYMWKSELKNLYFDLSKRMLATENGMKWQQYIRSKSKGQEFVQALAGNSSKASSNQPLWDKSAH
jgi:hypothetical protein